MNTLTFAEAYDQKRLGLELDQQEDIPFLVWLFENPGSPISLPGKINLFDHDCLHILLDLGVSSAEEAFILGFSMGTDLQTSWLSVQIFKCVSRYLYPAKYRFCDRDMQIFDRGFAYGRSRPIKYLNLVNYCHWLNSEITIQMLRSVLGLDMAEIRRMICGE